MQKKKERGTTCSNIDLSTSQNINTITTGLPPKKLQHKNAKYHMKFVLTMYTSFIRQQTQKNATKEK